MWFAIYVLLIVLGIAGSIAIMRKLYREVGEDPVNKGLHLKVKRGYED